MLYLSTKLHNLALFSIRTSGRIGTALQPIVNPHNLHIDGFYCQSVHSTKRLVLLDMHIRDISHKGIIIDDHNALSEPEELVRLKSVLDLNFELENKNVLVGKKKVGKILEYSVDKDSLFIQKLYVQPPLWKVINQSRLIFDRSSVIEVTDTYIIVKGPEVKVAQTKRAAAPKFSTGYSANNSFTNE